MSNRVKIELKYTIIENMKGIIVDHEARKDKDIVEFYADVFCDISEQYAKAKVLELENKIIQIIDKKADVKDYILRNRSKT